MYSLQCLRVQVQSDDFYVLKEEFTISSADPDQFHMQITCDMNVFRPQPLRGQLDAKGRTYEDIAGIAYSYLMIRPWRLSSEAAPFYANCSMQEAEKSFKRFYQAI